MKIQWKVKVQWIWKCLGTNYPWKYVIKLSMCGISAWLVTSWPTSNGISFCPLFIIFPKIVQKYTLNPNATKIHLETNNSAQPCLGDTTETNNWTDTCHKCHHLGMGQPFFPRVYQSILLWKYITFRIKTTNIQNDHLQKTCQNIYS